MGQYIMTTIYWDVIVRPNFVFYLGEAVGYRHSSISEGLLGSPEGALPQMEIRQ